MKIKKKQTLLESVEAIVEEAKNSKLSTEFYDKVNPFATHLAKVMDITTNQAITLSLFVEFAHDSVIQIKDFARLLDCGTIKMISLMNDIDVLIERKMIKKNKCEHHIKGVSYSVPMETVNAIKSNRKFEEAKNENLTIEEMFNKWALLFEEKNEDAINQSELIAQLDELIRINSHLEFSKQIMKYDINRDIERLMLFAIIELFINNDDDNVGWHDLSDYFDTKRSLKILESNMHNERLKMQKEKLIQYVNSNGLADRGNFQLTNLAKKELFAELDIEIKTEESQNRKLVKAETLATKKMFYNEKEQLQIETLQNLLAPESFQNVQDRLGENGMRKGFACLFYGAPGTGKTETVYQIAKQTGRDIFPVNVNEIKSCWVGESEKNMKGFFDTYREIAKKAELAPILLFNEADAVLGIRQEGAQRSVDKMNNSIQNIILQEMESLDGIMIATTNLTQNLDTAFERRFLYKIDFQKPSQEAKKSIWLTMIKDLHEDWATELAKAYSFSGGQIENIARKITVNKIINGNEMSLEMLKTYCNEEQLHKNEGKRIGFLG